MNGIDILIENEELGYVEQIKLEAVEHVPRIGDWIISSSDQNIFEVTNVIWYYVHGQLACIKLFVDPEK